MRRSSFYSDTLALLLFGSCFVFWNLLHPLKLDKVPCGCVLPHIRLLLVIFAGFTCRCWMAVVGWLLLNGWRIQAMPMVLATGDISLAYIGGHTGDFFLFLGHIWRLDENYYRRPYFAARGLFLDSSGHMSAYSVGLAASDLPARFFLPCWCFGACSWGSLAPSDGASACDINRVFGEVFDGPKGHTVLLQHPAQYVTLLD